MRHPRLTVAVAVGLVLAAGAVLVDGGLVSHRALAGPLAIARALGAGLADGTLGVDVVATAGRALAAVGLGMLAGVPLGLLVGLWPRARPVEPILDYFRAIPPLLILPVLLLAFGYGESARIGTAAAAAALVASLHVAAGARRGRPERARIFRALGASGWQRLRWLHAYETLPHVLTALRQAVAVSILVTVVVEMVLGSARGLGARAVAAQIAYDAPGLWSAIAVTGALGLAAGALVLAAERRCAAWR